MKPPPASPPPTCRGARCSRARRWPQASFRPRDPAPPRRRASKSSSPIAASCYAACPTRSPAPADTSRPTGSTCSSSIPAAATPPCRRWSAARSITPPPRSTLPFRPTPMWERTSAVSPSPGRLPLFAVVTAPNTASQIQSIKDLEGRTVGISALGNADHALTLYLLKQAGADAQKVKFATIGVNLLEALRQGQIDVGVVQEPALTLLRRAGARVLVNAMDLEDAKHHLGGSFEFMGVAVRAKEIERRRPEMVALAAALGDALKALRAMTGDQLSGALPKEITTGLDLKELGEIIARHRDSLYPETVTLDLDAAKRVEQSLIAAGLIKPGASMSGLHDTSIVGG